MLDDLSSFHLHRTVPRSDQTDRTRDSFLRQRLLCLWAIDVFRLHRSSISERMIASHRISRCRFFVELLFGVVRCVDRDDRTKPEATKSTFTVSPLELSAVLAVTTYSVVCFYLSVFVCAYIMHRSDIVGTENRSLVMRQNLILGYRTHILECECLCNYK